MVTQVGSLSPAVVCSAGSLTAAAALESVVLGRKATFSGRGRSPSTWSFAWRVCVCTHNTKRSGERDPQVVKLKRRSCPAVVALANCGIRWELAHPPLARSGGMIAVPQPGWITFKPSRKSF
ncbi:hypothetical protein BGZ57DRAFT_852867 [Hyaloscypha finlandica]|nr:hypothetical protein BGZ57DRAFT_852867 [Hyaloscypha finlandica]